MAVEEQCLVDQILKNWDLDPDDAHDQVFSLPLIQLKKPVPFRMAVYLGKGEEVSADHSMMLLDWVGAKGLVPEYAQVRVVEAGEDGLLSRGLLLSGTSRFVRSGSDFEKEFVRYQENEVAQ